MSMETLTKVAVIATVVASSTLWADTVRRDAATSTTHFLAGTVRDDNNRGVGNALVHAVHADGNVTTTGIADGNGVFRIPVPMNGKYNVMASKKGYVRSADVPLEANEAGDHDSGLILTSLPAIPPDQLTSAEVISRLPNSPDKMAFVDSCVACHSLGPVLQHGRTEHEWSQVLDRMSKYPGGYLRITDANRQLILNYLSQHFGLGSELPALLGKYAEFASEKAISVGHNLVFTEYDIPTPLAFPHTAVPDKQGSIWFTEFGGRKIGRLEIAKGQITEYAVAMPGVYPHGITAGPDGMVWYTAFPHGIGRINPETGSNEVLRVPVGASGDPAGAHSVIVGSDRKIWFTEIQNGSIGSFDPKSGKFARYMIEPGSAPYGIIEHGDQIFWFCLLRGSKIGFLNASTGEVRTYPTPTNDSEPQRLRFDTHGRLWFGEYESGKLGMFDPTTEQIVEYDLPFRGSAYSVHVDKHDDVWVASFERDTLIHFDPRTSKMIEFPLPGIGAIVRDIWPDDDGLMWFVQWGRNKVTSAEYLGSRRDH